MEKRTLCLEKAGHVYVFCYEPGCEDQMVDELIRLADLGRTDLDWLDAATLSFQVAHQAASSGEMASTLVRAVAGDQTQ